MLYVRCFYFMCVCVRSCSMHLTSWFWRYGLWTRPPNDVMGFFKRRNSWLAETRIHLKYTKLNQELRRDSSPLLSGKSISSEIRLSFYTAVNSALHLDICYWSRKIIRIFFCVLLRFAVFQRIQTSVFVLAPAPRTVCDWARLSVSVLWLDNSADCHNFRSGCRKCMIRWQDGNCKQCNSITWHEDESVVNYMFIALSYKSYLYSFFYFLFFL